MSIWTKIFGHDKTRTPRLMPEAQSVCPPPIRGVKPVRTAVRSTSAAPPRYEDQLKNTFALTYDAVCGWSFNTDAGSTVDRYKGMFSDPRVCYLLLRKMRGAGTFNRVCIVDGKPLIIVVEGHPPALEPIRTITSVTAAAADVAAAITAEGGRVEYEREGLLLVKLP